MDWSELLIAVGVTGFWSFAIASAFALGIWRQIKRQRAREALLRERIALVSRGLDPVTYQPLSRAGAEAAPNHC